ncbi:MAG: dodecin family protein [Gammaproteobacteria bacterium]
MSVARVTEISATSKKSFEDAVKKGVERASETLQGITSAWVADQGVTVKNGAIEEYKVRLKITFILKAAKK